MAAPRWLLVSAVAALAIAVAWLWRERSAEAGTWRAGVEAHVARAADLERANSSQLASHDAAIRGILWRLDRIERTQIEHYLWMAERVGDGPRAREMGRRLRALDAGP